LPAIDFGCGAIFPQLRSRCAINVLFLIGVPSRRSCSGPSNTRWGLLIRTAGESSDGRGAMGYSVLWIRLRATWSAASLPHRRVFSVAVHIPAAGTRASQSRPGHHRRGAGDLCALGPDLCLWASLAFGSAAALGPDCNRRAHSGYYLSNAAPYILTLAIMIITCFASAR